MKSLSGDARNALWFEGKADSACGYQGKARNVLWGSGLRGNACISKT